MAKLKSKPKLPSKRPLSISAQLELLTLQYNSTLTDLYNVRSERNELQDRSYQQSIRIDILCNFVKNLIVGQIFQYNNSNLYLSKINPAKIVPGSKEFQELHDYASGLIEVLDIQDGHDGSSDSTTVIQYIYDQAIRERIRERTIGNNQYSRDMAIAAGLVLGCDYVANTPRVKPDITWLIGEPYNAAKTDPNSKEFRELIDSTKAISGVA